MKTLLKPRKSASSDYATDEEKWHAVTQRDPAADGKFYYSVKSTGVYCRPSCASRPALRKNVAFHATPAAAEQAGFRPCKRCSPTGPDLAEIHRAAITRACQIIETAEETPDLATLARAAGMSTHHFHRVFKSVTGLTPKSYATAHRTQRVRQALEKGHSVTEAIYEAGFRSSGRFYAQSSANLGMTPTRFRAGGPETTIRFAVGECSLGSVLVAMSEQGVCAITLGDDPDALLRDLQDRFPKARLIGGDPSFEDTVARVVGFIETPSRGLDLPLDIRGTAFQQKVWKALQQIPLGTTASYADIAQRIGSPKSVRAVAGACAANALAVAIPCHRVVRQDGSLSGYRWGVDRKRSLLKKEALA